MRLTRARSGRMLGGVCAGIALHFGWDVALLRILVVVGTLFVGATVLAYIALWMLMPAD
ncbi:PspC domain-containing protein [Salinibacterium sp. SYSU T00001]|uniref:PspC domain-containing protein n=1 Tax=Homoserinimonas sedimenticola TaxID=2986805 RepID=UPI0022364CE9|nr:PspC domain-containing protein [Salinibacterium sedimenticola]MCW4385914.1 PspC domain-containing protein [Salinibacterium sedimenticola]